METPAPTSALTCPRVPTSLPGFAPADGDPRPFLRRQLAELAAKLAQLSDAGCRLQIHLNATAGAWEPASRPWQEAIARGGACLGRLEAWQRWCRRVRQQGGLSLPLWRARPGGPAAVQARPRLDGTLAGAAASHLRPRRMPGRPSGPEAAARGERGQAMVVWREPEAPPASPTGRSRRRALKQVWRQLAWRHHPDRADRTGPAQGDPQMHRINALYAAGELELLTALWGGAQPDDLVLATEEPAAEETARLRAHILHIAGQEAQARADLAGLRDTFAHQVWAQVDRGESLDKVCAHHWQEHLQALTAKVEATAVDLGDSVHSLESPSRSWLPHPTGLAQRADGEAHLKMAVAAVTTAPGGPGASPADAQAAGLGEQMAKLACAHPHLGALLSLTYLAGRARSTLLGLERFADWDARYRALSRDAHQPDGQGLAEALMEAMHWVEWGLRPSAAQLEGSLLPGLCFVPEGGQAGMHIAAQSPVLRRQIGEALEVLGEAGSCGGCQRQIFFVALWQLAGIDSLRALVCPACGHRQRSYRLACGEDVVAALGDLALEHGLVHELTVEVPACADAAFRLQLTAQEIEGLSLADLAQRLVDDIFRRRGVDATHQELRLLPSFEADVALAPDTPLAALPCLDFILEGQGVSVGAWQERWRPILAPPPSPAAR